MGNVRNVRNVQKIVAISAKELLLFLKDPAALALTFLMPFAFIVLMSLAQGRLFGETRSQPITVLVVNEDEGDLASRTIRDLRRIPDFLIVSSIDERPLTKEVARDLVARGQSGVALVFPPNFSEAFEQGLGADPPIQAEVRLIADPALSFHYIEPLQRTLGGLLRELAITTMVPAAVDDLAVTLETQSETTKQNPAFSRGMLRSLARQAWEGLGERISVERDFVTSSTQARMPDTYQQNVPGYTIFGVFWIVALISGSIVREKGEGTFRRLRAAPISPWTVLVGKLVPYFLINVVQIILMLGASVLLFRLDLGQSFLALFVVSMVTALTASAMGILVATMVRTEAQAGTLSTLILLVFSALGGCFVPRFIMPEWLQSAGFVVPQSWALTAYQDLFVRGQDLSGVLPEVFVLLIFAASFFALGVSRFRLDS